MARTSPAPNIPPIPGMCPGVAVAGGGGGGGGAGGKGSKKGKGKKGAGKKKGKKNAKGGKKNGKKGGKGKGECGKGGGCPSPGHGKKGKKSAGDPVDVTTGQVQTIPATDLTLPGLVPVVIERAYSSTSIEHNVGLGLGWSHSYAWTILVRRKELIVHGPEGLEWEVTIPEADEAVQNDDLTLCRHPEGFTIQDREDDLFMVFTRVPGAPKQLLVLTSVTDRHGNALRFAYANGELDGIVDSVGREIKVRRTPAGMIRAFEVKTAPHQGRWVAFRTYEYEGKLLIGACDNMGSRTSYTYDADGRLLSERSPEGVTAHFRYDQTGRCIETWVERGPDDPSISKTAPAILADGRTPARGVFHCKLDFVDEGYTEVTTSKTLQRFFHSDGIVEKTQFGSSVHDHAFDDNGNLIRYTDGEGLTWTWEYDDVGRVRLERDPLGAETTYEYGYHGFLSATTHPSGHRVEHHRREDGLLLQATDQLGQVISCDYDDRGQMIRSVLPNGGVTEMSYDEMSNRVRVREPNGGVREIRYDYLGHVLAEVDELRRETRYVYNDNRALIRIDHPDGTSQHWEYDRDGSLTAAVLPDGARWSLAWGGLGMAHSLRRPDGSMLHFRYDREGDLVEVINAKGEHHGIHRDVAGRVVGDDTFDERRLRYQLDSQGRITRIESTSGRSVAFVYDAVGRVVGRVYSDGTEDAFTYDLSGRLLAAETEDVRCDFAWDLRGRLLRETQTIGGEARTVTVDYDDMNNPVVMQFGPHRLQYAYDVMGMFAGLRLGDDNPLLIQRDLVGNELRRILPGGGSLQFAYDAMDRLIFRDVLPPGSPDISTEPVWVGQGGRSGTQFGRNANGSIVRSVSSLTSTEVRVDALQRLQAVLPAGGRERAFQFDGDDELFDDRIARHYGPGGLLLRRGEVEYEYDADHRLVRKTAPNQEVWTYEWDDRNHLVGVVRPDGGQVRLVYDAFARRIAKRTLDAEGRLVGEERRVWSQDQMVQAIHERAAESGDPIVSERTYAFAPAVQYPVAQQDVVRGVGSGWSFFVVDEVARPIALVDRAGNVQRELTGDPLGAMDVAAADATDLRFQGQFEDAEIGLFYNRHRHYDSQTGLYISPEPAGLEGGLASFLYARGNPLEWFDEDGLGAGMGATVSGGGVSPTSGGSTSATGVKAADADIHPVIKDAMPKTGLVNSYGKPRDPAACAEPRAMSDHLRKWEKKNNNGKPLDPNNPKDKPKIKKALADMKVGAKQKSNGKKRAPCANCSQTMANLMNKYGAPDPNSISKGATSWNATNSTNFTPPPQGQKGFGSYDAALKAGGWK